MDYWLSGGVGAPYPDEPFLHANTAPVSLPIAQHHAWRDQLSASPIEVTGNNDFTIPTPPRVNTHPVDMLSSEPPIPKSSYSSSPRQPIDDNGPYQLCSFGEKAMEEYFEQVGKRVVEDAQSNEAYNIFADAVPTTQDRLSVLDQSESRLKHVTAKVSIPSDHKSNFLRHFQCNEARLAELQRNIGSEKGSKLSAMQLSSAIKRVKVGSKDRVLCMVVDCEKHAQTRCSGCCTAHFRLLNSPAGNDKKVGYYRRLRTPALTTIITYSARLLLSHGVATSSSHQERRIGQVPFQRNPDRNSATRTTQVLARRYDVWGSGRQ